MSDSVQGDHWETQKNMTNEARHVINAAKQINKEKMSGVSAKVVDIPKNQGFSDSQADRIALARKQLGN